MSGAEVRLGFGLVTCQLHPNDPDRGPATVYAEAVQPARLCEDAGLDSYWVSEHHLADDGT